VENVRYGLLGLALTTKGSCHDNQILGKLSQNCTNFSSVHDIETLFAFMVGFSWSADTNMLSAFSREQRELPWQPNLGKNKPKMH